MDAQGASAGPLDVRLANGLRAQSRGAQKQSGHQRYSPNCTFSDHAFLPALPCRRGLNGLLAPHSTP